MKEYNVNEQTLAIIRLSLAAMAGVQIKVRNFVKQFKQAKMAGRTVANITLVENIAAGEEYESLIYEDFPRAMQLILDELLPSIFPDVVFKKPMLCVSPVHDEEDNEIAGHYSMNLLATVSLQETGQQTNEK